MHKKFPILFILILNIFCHQNSFAHGAGGGGGSYEFDKNDGSAARDREAEKRAAEKKQDQESWGDFMSAINHKKKETDTEKKSADHDDNHTGH